ncbi:MAG: hypothetical protein GY757_31410 [bacterium]|nr:hypothetical protein [bacterium]
MEYKAGDDSLFAVTFNGTPVAGQLDIHYRGAAGTDLSHDSVDGDGHTGYFTGTVDYLDSHPDVNVVMWSWCSIEGHNVQIYLDNYQELIDLYKAGGSKGRTAANAVTFVFMTGYSRGYHGDTPEPPYIRSPYQNHKRIVDYCEANGYFCLDYWSQDTYHYETDFYKPTENANTNIQHKEYFDTHEEGVHWFATRNYATGAIKWPAHTDSLPQHITSNRRAYGAWWIWARLAGWDGNVGVDPAITVTSPNGGESWSVNSSQTISWTSSGDVGNVTIELSTTGLTGSFSPIAESIANSGSYSWSVADVDSSSCVIRISNADASVSDSGDAVFTIEPVVVDPVITVTAPNGGESWTAGSSQNITWTNTGDVPNVTIELSTSGLAGSFAPIAESIANSGSFSWTVADVDSLSCVIRISDSGMTVSDSSDAVFTIEPAPEPQTITLTAPNGGNVWEAGTTQAITWTSTGEVGNVTVELSTTGLSGSFASIAASIANSGSFSWTVADADSSQCAIRVSNADGSVADSSNAVFTIEPAPEPQTITLTAPNGGELWEAGTTQAITWTSTGVVGNVTVELSTTGLSGSFASIAASIANSGSFSWTVADADSSQCVIRVRNADGSVADSSNAVFTIEPAPADPVISVTSPNGGEIWKVGSTEPVTWSFENIDGNVDIYLYKENIQTLLIGTAPVDSGSFSWSIPEDLTPADDYNIRIVQESSSIEDVSNAYFSIIPLLYAESDFNGDGIADIPWHSDASGENVLWLRGTATPVDSVFNPISNPGAVSLTAQDNVQWKLRGTGDFNSDGNVDLLWRNVVDGSNSVWLMDGVNRSAVVALDAEPDLDWDICDTGDFNGDGKVDIMWRNFNTGRNEIRFLDGVTGLGSASLRTIPVANNWTLACTGDFNGDGQLDIVLRSLADGRNLIWYMNGTKGIGRAALAPERDLNWIIAGTADFNNDGSVDVLWRNQADGRNMIWFLDGITTIGTEFITTVTNPDWNSSL